MGELNRRPNAPDPAAQIADLKAQHNSDRAALTRPDARRDPSKSPFARPEARRDPDPADRPANDPRLDAANAKITELNTKVDTLESDKAKTEAKLEAANARITEQDRKIEAQDGELKAANAKIAEQDSRLDRLEAAFGDVHERLKRFESADAPSVAKDDPTSRVRNRTLDDDGQRNKVEKPRWINRGPSNEAVGLMSTTFGTGLAEASQLVPGSTLLTGALTGIIGIAAAGVPVLRRHLRKARNADRPQD